MTINLFNHSDFTATGEKNKKGYDIFAYSGSARNSGEVADLFDAWDTERGDRCKNVGTLNVYRGDDGKFYVKAGCGSEISGSVPEVVDNKGCRGVYTPHSRETKELFKEAAHEVSVPEAGRVARVCIKF